MKSSVIGSNLEVSNKESSEISIWLDSYDEIFSDFDPRPYPKRTISDDFILQIRKVTKDRYDKKMMLKLLLPEHLRNSQDEEIISYRLHDYFELNKVQFQKEKRKTNLKGLLLTIIGIVLMMIAGYISLLKSDAYYLHLLFILFEPAGWFILWMGLDHLVYYPGNTKKELNFFLHISDAKIEFGSYT